MKEQKMMHRKPSKVYQIIEQEFDGRLAMSVLSYILEKGYENVRNITDRQIERKCKGGVYTSAEFEKMYVRTARRICRECSMTEIVRCMQTEWRTA